MRTTVEISDSLMKQVRETMRRRGVTLRALVEDGLRSVTSQEDREPTELPDARFSGRVGLVADLSSQDLPRLIAATLAEGRDS